MAHVTWEPKRTYSRPAEQPVQPVQPGDKPSGALSSARNIGHRASPSLRLAMSRETGRGEACHRHVTVCPPFEMEAEISLDW